LGLGKTDYHGYDAFKQYQSCIAGGN
jgi:hypothetical protein